MAEYVCNGCDEFVGTCRQAMLGHVTTQQFRDYLDRKGWVECPFGCDTVIKFVAPNGSECCDVFIPARPELIDYNRTAELAIYGIAAVEDRHFYNVLSDIIPSTTVELIELRQLILDCAGLISKHGDDFALSQALESLKSREQNLSKQLHEDRV